MSGFTIAVAATMWALQSTSPMGVTDLGTHATSAACYHAKQARQRTQPRHSPIQFDCVPVRVDARVDNHRYPQPSYPYSRHPGYYPDVRQDAVPPYVPYDGRHNLRPHPNYRGAPLVDRSQQSVQRWYESWQNGRMGCPTPRQCM